MDNLFISLTHIGHILIGFYFVFFGFWNIYHWIPLLKVMTEKKIPHPYLLLALGIAGQTIGGMMIMFGVLSTLVALIFIPFVLITGYIFHDFWNHTGEIRRLNLNLFVTHLSLLIGALLLLH